jgi:hypothetical protein
MKPLHVLMIALVVLALQSFFRSAPILSSIVRQRRRESVALLESTKGPEQNKDETKLTMISSSMNLSQPRTAPPMTSTPKSNTKFYYPPPLPFPDAKVAVRPSLGEHRPQQDAIFAFAVGYARDQLVPFISSLLETGYQGDLVLGLNHDMDDDLQEFMEYHARNHHTVVYEIAMTGRWFDEDLLFQTVGMYQDGEGRFLNDTRRHRRPDIIRLEYYWAWSNLYSDASRIWLLDARDTYFQQHPFSHLHSLQTTLITFEEAILVGQKGYNKLWLRMVYGRRFVKLWADRNVTCSGTILGGKPAIEMYTRALMAQWDATRCSVRGCDQALHIFLILGKHVVGAPNISKVKVFHQGEGLANNMGGLTRDFANLDSLGLWQNNTALNYDGTPSAIVHQFDRDANISAFVSNRTQEWLHKWFTTLSKLGEGLNRTRRSNANRTLPIYDFYEPAWQQGLYEGPICPGMLEVSKNIINSTRIFEKLRVLMLQMEGTWNDEPETGIINHLVYLHNARMATRMGYSSETITDTLRWDSREAPYAKAPAVKEYCLSGEFDLVWFLDGDVLLMNPHIRVEMVWYYYQSRYPQLDALFSVDFDGLNSGVFIVNCSSDTAIRLLDYWHYYTNVTNNWHNINQGLYEQNGLHWLLQEPIWKVRYPDMVRIDELDFPNVSSEEIELFSVKQLQQRIVRVEAACQMSVYCIDFQYRCKSINKDPQYGKYGPLWWEDGHWMVHMAGVMRNPFLRGPYMMELIANVSNLTSSEQMPFNHENRLSYFLQMIINGTKNATQVWRALPAPANSVQEAAQRYIHQYENLKSINPPRKVFDLKHCTRTNSRAMRLYDSIMAERRNKTATNVTIRF